jgi:phosphatidylglycerol:prolipoprotein diacylglycerol transferase
MSQTFNVEFEKIGLKFSLNSVCFYLGEFAIKYYGIVVALAFLCSILFVFKKSKFYEISSNFVFNSIILSMITSIIGARLYYVLFYPGSNFKKNIKSILYIREGGLAVYGGIIFAGATLFFFCKKNKIELGHFFDMMSTALILGQAIGRWGNFFNQEAFGTATNLPWGMKSEETDDVSVHPCFLYESFWCLLGFILMNFWSKKQKDPPGKIFFLYLVWYGTGRFFIEALRTDSLVLPEITFLKVSQLLSFLFVIAGSVGLILILKKSRMLGDRSI